LIGRLQLVILGLISTVITQSSSAGVAATLTALYAGTVNFKQAAALVIGMDVGTTVTAIMATLGGSINARRTGFSHVLYNLWSASLALLILTPYTWIVERLAPGQLVDNAEISLVAFHTCFNVLAVIAILPFSQQFASLITRLMPSQGLAYTDGLSLGLLEQPRLALNAAQAAIQTELLALLQHVEAILGSPQGHRTDLSELQIALDETHAYLDRIHVRLGNGPDWERLISMFHALDHLQRIHERCEEDEDRARTAQVTQELSEEYHLLLESIQDIVALIQTHRWQAAADRAQEAASLIHRSVRPYRATTVSQIARGQIDVLTGTARLESIRWLRRVSKHITRITEHLNQAILAIGK
jgi:phosphate:Na+ symporter